MYTRNTTILSHAHTVYSAKKKARREQLQEVLFDEDARREYLTGFRKRNLKKKEDKRKKALERERLERLELRKQHRQDLAERAAKNVKQVETALGMLPTDDDNADMDSATESIEAQEEAMEFEDEEQLAVVTVVEDFNPDSILHPEPRQSTGKTPLDPSQLNSASYRAGESAVPGKKSSRLQKIKNKPKKIRYETQAARKTERTKQRSRRAEKAERAGGKNMRRSKR